VLIPVLRHIAIQIKWFPFVKCKQLNCKNLYLQSFLFPTAEKVQALLVCCHSVLSLGNKQYVISFDILNLLVLEDHNLFKVFKLFCAVYFINCQSFKPTRLVLLPGLTILTSHKSHVAFRRIFMITDHESSW